MAPTPTQARMGAHKSWARTEDRAARTAPARAARQAKFELEVDPEGRLSPGERAIRADHARKAFYASMQTRSAEVRRARRLAAEVRVSGSDSPSAPVVGQPRGDLEAAS